MSIFSGYLLASDFDGTLLNGQREISDANINAINYFISEGGLFCGATGRSELSVSAFLPQLPKTTPWILYNGSVIYDFTANRFLYRKELNRELAQRFVKKVISVFNNINVQVYTGGPFFYANENAPEDPEAVIEKFEFEYRAVDKIPDGWLKILFNAEPLMIDNVEEIFAQDEFHYHVNSMRSDAVYLEFTPKNTTKGSALLKLKELISPRPRCVVAIGDYPNDIEMLQAADISAAPSSAYPTVKKVAEIITSPNTNSAVADLIEKLKQRS